MTAVICALVAFFGGVGLAGWLVYVLVVSVRINRSDAATIARNVAARRLYR